MISTTFNKLKMFSLTLAFILLAMTFWNTGQVSKVLFFSSIFFFILSLIFLKLELVSANRENIASEE